jgi:hypothetical protein
LPAGRSIDVDRHQGLEGGRGVGADQAQLAHVRNVEQAGRVARVLVLGHQAGGVLHRHRVAGEGHHAGAELDVEVVQGRLEGVGASEEEAAEARRGHGALQRGRRNP